MAERVLVSLDNVTLTFGGKPLFKELTMHIAENDKICLIGKNGAGKTTLMRLIMDELDLDGGKRFALPGIRIGYLAQSVEHNPEHTVRQFILANLPHDDEFENKEHLVDIMASQLDIVPEAIMKTLSGGQLRRAALARALLEEPDLLMLDEPTNHLDIHAIEWLEGYLASYRGALVCVSHDRAFLAAISRKVFWIDRGKIRVCPGGYKAFEEWSEQIIEHEARELQNLQKKFLAEIDWTQGGVSARRKRNQRRLNELFRLREKLRSDKAALKERLRKIELDPLESVQGSKIVAEFKEVSKSFFHGDKEIPILKNFDLRILRGDRIGVLGKNGSGKSTFIKLLTDQLQPDSGRIFRGKTIDIAYFDQNRTEIDGSKTLWDTLCPKGGDHVFLGSGEERRPMHVCGYLKSFLFDPKMARDKVETLSGGQQNRLMLAKLLANPGNVLILDEPTNDLDMDTLDMLQEILADYPGTLIIVSHDRDFLDRTVTEVIAFEGNAVIDTCIGGYTDYHRKKSELASLAMKKATVAMPSEVSSSSTKKKSADKMTFKLKHELEKLPEKIASLETEIEQLKATLSDGSLYVTQPEVFDKATRRFEHAQHELHQAEHRWLELEALKDRVGS